MKKKMFKEIIKFFFEFIFPLLFSLDGIMLDLLSLLEFKMPYCLMMKMIMNIMFEIMKNSNIVVVKDNCWLLSFMKNGLSLVPDIFQSDYCYSSFFFTNNYFNNFIIYKILFPNMLSVVIFTYYKMKINLFFISYLFYFFSLVLEYLTLLCVYCYWSYYYYYKSMYHFFNIIFHSLNNFFIMGVIIYDSFNFMFLCEGISMVELINFSVYNGDSMIISIYIFYLVLFLLKTFKDDCYSYDYFILFYFIILFALIIYFLFLMFYMNFYYFFVIMGGYMVLLFPSLTPLYYNYFSNYHYYLEYFSMFKFFYNYDLMEFLEIFYNYIFYFMDFSFSIILNNIFYKGMWYTFNF